MNIADRASRGGGSRNDLAVSPRELGALDPVWLRSGAIAHLRIRLLDDRGT